MPKLNPPTKFICARSKKLMTDPVEAADGQFYERYIIELWLKEHDVSPFDESKRLSHKNLMPNEKLRHEIEVY